jgi:hypothetical protein
LSLNTGGKARSLWRFFLSQTAIWLINDYNPIKSVFDDLLSFLTQLHQRFGGTCCSPWWSFFSGPQDMFFLDTGHVEGNQTEIVSAYENIFGKGTIKRFDLFTTTKL